MNGHPLQRSLRECHGIEDDVTEAGRIPYNDGETKIGSSTEIPRQPRRAPQTFNPCQNFTDIKFETIARAIVLFYGVFGLSRRYERADPSVNRKERVLIPRRPSPPMVIRTMIRKRLTVPGITTGRSGAPSELEWVGGGSIVASVFDRLFHHFKDVLVICGVVNRCPFAAEFDEAEVF